MTMPGVIAQEPRGAITLPSFLSDVVFQSSFNGTDGGTNATDDSFLHAPITFAPGTKLSNAQTLFGSTTSLRCQGGFDFVSTPANAAYNITGDFTAEGFVRPFVLGFLSQLIGVWGNDNSLSTNQWRVAYDGNYLIFQYAFGGGILQFKFTHGWLTDTWYYWTWCRYAGVIRCFVGQPGGNTALMFKGLFSDSIVQNSANLYIGGNADGSSIQVGANAFIAHMRLTRAAWYRDDNPFPVPSSRFGQGQIFPPLYVDPDIIRAPFLGQVLGAAMPADDVIPAPTVARSPTFLNLVATNGATGGTSGAPSLIGSRVNGQLLIAFIQLDTPQASSTPFSVSGGWTMGDQQNNSGWAWRIVDGTETNPTFSWAANSVWHARMYQFQDTNVVTPIGAKLKGTGSSGSLTLNGAVGLTTTGAVSTAFAILLTMNSSQTIPLPTGYTGAGSAFGDGFGSDRASFQYQGLAGTVSGAVDVVISPSVWAGFLIELLRK
jgi:hypothetical protein